MLSLDEIVQYFASERPDWAATIATASAEDIASIEAHAERPLPPVYRRYLELLGREPGVLFDTYAGANPRAARILEHFAAGGWRPTPPYFLFGRDPKGSPLDLFLCEQADGTEPSLVAFAMPGEPGNLRHDGPERPTLHAPNLGSFMFRAGFDNLIGTQFALLLRARVTTPAPDHPALIDQALASVGLRHEAGSDRWTSSHRAHEAAAQWLRNGPEDTLWIRAWSDDEALLRVITDAISRCVPLIVDGVHPASGPIFI